MVKNHRYYETLYLTRPDLTDDDLDKIQKRIMDNVMNQEGKIFKSEKWDERELAYEINDYKRGVYYIMIYKALPEVVVDLEKNFRFFSDDVLRFMTVKIEEELADKHKADSEKKAEREIEETSQSEIPTEQQEGGAE